MAKAGLRRAGGETLMKLRAWVIGAFAIVVLSLQAQGQLRDIDQKGDLAGCIDQISGEVYFKKIRSDEPTRLTRQDVGRCLRFGERLRCAKGGYVKIRFYQKWKEIKGPSVWYPIPHPSLSESDPRRLALEQFGGGGRPRSGGTVIFSPANDSVITPGRFAIRWVASVGDKNITLAILDDAKKVIWREQNAEEETGQLVSESARQALLKFRSAGGKGVLTLTLAHPDEQTEQVRFSVLSLESEASLAKELVEWNREKASLLRHAYRAYAFSSRGMLAEVVEEYEAALAEAPDSRNLLAATIVANRNIGNSLRARDLLKRLPPGANVP
jgi:hypothetical protein